MQSPSVVCHVINRPMHMLMLLFLSFRWHDIWNGGLQKGQVRLEGPAALQAAAREANLLLCQQPCDSSLSLVAPQTQSSPHAVHLQKFDAARASPALLDFLDTGKLQVADKRVVVPGCG